MPPFLLRVLALATIPLWAGPIDLNHEAIRYATAPVNDPVAQLERDLDAQKARLRYDRSKGYLPALLEALGVPVESQMLVFSKTSFQASRINATSPRAIYFNDRVAVGFVHGGDVLEIAAQDPRQGTVFYTLDQDPALAPSFARRDDACLQCHLNGATSDVPGLVIRSIYPERSGMPLFQAGGFISDHRSPIEQRWGGWFVTGQHGSQMHMGNAFARDRQNPNDLDTSDSLNRRELPLMVRRDYLSPYSDIVALLVAEHQFRTMNLITRLNFETRLALHQRDQMARVFGGPSAESGASAQRRIRQQADELLEYLLFVGEAPLTAPIQGSSRFGEVFEKSGPADGRRGRSLRQLHLRSRLFRYPLSYLVYSPAFHNLPPEALGYLSQRLAEVLAAPVEEGKYARLSAEDRRNILEILAATKQELPALLVAALAARQP